MTDTLTRAGIDEAQIVEAMIQAIYKQRCESYVRAARSALSAILPHIAVLVDERDRLREAIEFYIAWEKARFASEQPK